nr:hypothetical protein [Bacilli bacterium]
MTIDQDIKMFEQAHENAVHAMLDAERHLERLYTERHLADAMYRKLGEDGVAYDIEVDPQSDKILVRLRKNNVSVTCAAKSLSTALMGARAALMGDAHYAF